MTLETEAQDWLDAMIGNLNEPGCEAPLTKDTIEEYIEWHVEHSFYPNDTARNAALQAINKDYGMVVFTSPDDGKPCLSTGAKLIQMLQMDSLEAAMNAVDARMIY